MKMRKVMQERGERGHQMIYKISGETSIRDVAKYMCEITVGALMVYHVAKGEDSYCGIISQRDVVKCCAQNDDLDRTMAAEVMSTNMVVADINDEADEVITIMAKKHIRHIPILDDKKVVALISVRDILHSLALEHEITIRHMSDYLSSTRLNDVY